MDRFDTGAGDASVTVPNRNGKCHLHTSSAEELREGAVLPSGYLPPEVDGAARGRSVTKRSVVCECSGAVSRTMLGLLVMSAAVAMTAAQLQQLKKQNRPPFPPILFFLAVDRFSFLFPQHPSALVQNLLTFLTFAPLDWCRNTLRPELHQDQLVGCKGRREDNDEPSVIISITLSFRTGGGREAREKQSLPLSGPSKGHMTHLSPKPGFLTVVISVKQEM
ncbi:unnamed protein product [Leuciscus chuanchicus]